MAELPKTGPELVRFYNERADEIGVKRVKRFATTAKAVARCEKIDEEVRRKKESGDIVSSATESVSAVSEGNSQKETIANEDTKMSTQVQVSFEKQVVRKKTPPKTIPETIWKRGPRLKSGSKMSTLTEALLKKPMTVKEMSQRLYRKWSPNVRTILGGVQYLVKGGYVKATWEYGESSNGEKTFRLLKKK